MKIQVLNNSNKNLNRRLYIFLLHTLQKTLNLERNRERITL